MDKVTKPGKDKAISDKPATIGKKGDAELTEDELKKVSGGPTAVEMPGRFKG